MPHGRKTGGRQLGTPNKATVERQLRAAHGVAAATQDGLLPLDVILARMRGEPMANGDFVTDDQFQAACAAAPYIHPKLSAVAVKDDRPSAAQLDLSRLTLEELQLLSRFVGRIVRQPEVLEGTQE
jgi:hypothetical protein